VEGNRRGVAKRPRGRPPPPEIPQPFFIAECDVATQAYHLWLAAHRHMYTGDFDSARRMSLLLSEFEELFDPRDIYALQALSSYYSGYYGRCSKAFLKLESLPSIPSHTQSAFQVLPPLPPAPGRHPLPPPAASVSSASPNVPTPTRTCSSQ
jgi:hypothetical protein